MPIKNQLPTLSKLYSIYGEIPEDLLDEADIDSYFYYSILNITKKENRLVRLSKTSNKNSFNLKVFIFDCSTIQQKYSLSEDYFDKTRNGSNSGLFERFLTTIRSS